MSEVSSEDVSSTDNSGVKDMWPIFAASIGGAVAHAFFGWEVVFGSIVVAALLKWSEPMHGIGKMIRRWHNGY